MITPQDSQTPARVSIIGCGYVGQRLALHLTEWGQRVDLLSRSPTSVETISASGLRATSVDLDDDVSGPLSETASNPIVFYLVPPPAKGSSDPRLERFLASIPTRPERIVYVSTSGVYGDCRGAVVDETRPPNPATGRAKRRLAAESTLRAWCRSRDVSWIILRVTGIYGPGRLPVDRLSTGAPFLDEQDAPPGNRIHRDDVVACLRAAATSNQSNRIYNVSDGDWMTSTAFARLTARIAGLDPPRTIPRSRAQAVMTPMQLSFLDESRRIDNSRILAELAPLQFSDPADGIRQALVEDGFPVRA